MRDRRAFLKSVIAAAAASMAVPAGATARPPDGMSRESWYLYRMLAGVEVGEPFVADWAVIDAYPPRAGALILVVANGLEDPVRVDVCRRGNPVRAPAYTEQLELYVMDGGAGRRQIPDDLVAALQVLADRLQDNEAQDRLADELLTHTQRLRRYPEFMERAAKDLAPGPLDQSD